MTYAGFAGRHQKKKINLESFFLSSVTFFRTFFQVFGSINSYPILTTVKAFGWGRRSMRSPSYPQETHSIVKGPFSLAVTLRSMLTSLF